MRVLVTGGAGFIGSHVVDRLLDRGDTAICVDNFNDYYSPEVKESNIAPCLTHPNFKLYRADICDLHALEHIFQTEKVDKIVHLAARAGVRVSIEQPLLCVEANIKGTVNILEMAKKFRSQNLVFASSSSVYGNNSHLPFGEDDPTNSPLSPYGATKIAGERLCFAYHHLFGLNITCLRLFTVYGPRGRPDMAVYKFTRSIMEGKPIELYGDGLSKRDYTYVDDVVNGILAALDKNLGFEIINIGDSNPIELRQLVSLIEQVVGAKARVVYTTAQPGDVQITYADITEAKKLLGYEPRVNIKDGLARFVAWLKLSAR